MYTLSREIGRRRVTQVCTCTYTYTHVYIYIYIYIHVEIMHARHASFLSFLPCLPDVSPAECRQNTRTSRVGPSRVKPMSEFKDFTQLGPIRDLRVL